MTWMIYGANGYTGRLIAEHAASLGEKPVLAGRREAPIRALAERLNLPWRIFPIASADAELDGIDAAVLAAGPFSETGAPFLGACLRQKTHYLDITGEIELL